MMGCKENYIVWLHSYIAFKWMVKPPHLSSFCLYYYPQSLFFLFFLVFPFVGPGFDRKKQISNEQMVIDATFFIG